MEVLRAESLSSTQVWGSNEAQIVVGDESHRGCWLSAVSSSADTNGD